MSKDGWVERWATRRYFRKTHGRQPTPEQLIDEVEFEAAKRYIKVLQRPTAFDKTWMRWFPPGLLAYYVFWEWVEDPSDTASIIRMGVAAMLVSMWSWNWHRQAVQVKDMGDVVKYWTSAEEPYDLLARWASTSPSTLPQEKDPDQWRSVVWWVPPEWRTQGDDAVPGPTSP